MPKVSPDAIDTRPVYFNRSLRFVKPKIVRRSQPCVSAALTLVSFLLTPARLHPASPAGAAFLKIPIGARAVSLGNVGTAISNDPSAIHWNPAALSQFKRPELGFAHAALYEDTRLDFLGYVQPTPMGNFGVGATSLSSGRIEGRDVDGRKTSSFDASDLAVGLSFSPRLAQTWDLGLGIKWIRQSIAEASATGLALDAGLLYKPADSLQFGLAGRNLGPKLKFEEQAFSLPSNVSLGAGYFIAKQATLGLEMTKPLHSPTEFGMGLEYRAFPAVFLRVGYMVAGQTQNHNGGPSAFSKLSLGLGLRFASFSVDYAFSPMGELGPVQRISVAMRL